ncbi:MAG: putative heme d1 biosynthesis radical SAM protein NirJ2 [Peptococcaceae bacterium]|nr:putative heme d1 biosynthesis radical SAM protein NirJ2 [Peptococcaceae bacterium]
MIVSWNTTNACNLKCKHCYRDAGTKAQKELSTEEGLALVDQIAEAGFKIMIFSGGEPLMRDDIYKLTERARDRGMRPVFGTNGTLLNGKVAGRLKSAGAVTMGISLDSIDRDSHDQFRAVPGSWQQAVDGMEACRNAGLPFQIHTTVMEWNLQEVEQLTDFAVEMGAVGHHIFFLVPTGRAVDIEKETLRAAQYESLLGSIMSKQTQVAIELKPTCAPQFMRIADQMGVQTRFTKGCLAGISYCIINPVGMVQPCAYLSIKAGDVRRETFGEIWRNAPVFQELRTGNYKGGCGICKYKEICGGCRARAYYYHGDYLAEEPWCLYRSG